MRIVIDIPEKIYNYVQLIGSISMLDTQQIANAIFDGTPLPKGHGRLIDADALDFEKCTLETDSSISYYMVDKDDIDDAPTIIEADREV